LGAALGVNWKGAGLAPGHLAGEKPEVWGGRATLKPPTQKHGEKSQKLKGSKTHILLANKGGKKSWESLRKW